MVSPLFAHRADVRDARHALLGRLASQAQVQADALGVHLGLLEAELLRLARHEGLSPQDGVSAQERSLLENAFHHSSLFSEGVALLSAEGKVLWSDPPQMELGHTPLSARSWYRQVRANHASDVDLLEPEKGPVLLAVPVAREGKLLGMLIGEVRAAALPMAGMRGQPETTVLLLDPQGHWLLTAPPLSSHTTKALQGPLQALLASPATLTVAGTRMLAAAAPVHQTGLLLAVLEDESQATEPLRRRLLGQLIFQVAIIGGTLLLCTLLLRYSYRSLLTAEERLRRQETMAALGTAASLIAHEVKNALNGMQAAVSRLRPAVAGDEMPLQAMRAQVKRLSHLALSLLSFGAPRAALRHRHELRLLVEEALQSVQLLPESEAVTLEVSLEEGLRVQADAALLIAAIDNLVRNAIEAGAVARDTGLQPSPRVSVRLRREDTEGVLLVEDNAGGVDPVLEPRLWEPFATGRAKGIGLGLPMAKTAVQAHGGALSYTRWGEGSRFTLRLPLEKPE